MIKWLPYNFQNFESIQLITIDWLNDYIFIFLFFILVTIGGILFSLSKNFFLNIKLLEASFLEFFWTVIPGFILVFIGIPSLSVLYRMESTNIFNLTLKITGNQWYWSYDYSDFQNIEFDRYLKPLEDLGLNEPRLLETDNKIILPYLSSVRLLISSSDVLHRWAIPSLGLKADANPGRLNILSINSLDICGIFYGQCSEICGANHSFMPISLEVSPFYSFIIWLKIFLSGDLIHGV